MACNARCFYCFEQGAEPKTMTDETADAVFDYIMRTKHEKDITLQWFGGEPLCNTKVIDRICKKLRESGVRFVSQMLTNGLLFTEELAEEAKNTWNLKWCQITLDGMAEEYKRRKNYKGNVENPFQIVMDNVRRLLEKDIQVTIRMNMDLNNVEDITKLEKFLKDRFGKYKNFSAYPVMILNEWFAYTNSETQAQREELFARFREVDAEIEGMMKAKQKGISKTIPQSHCMANSLTAAIISPDGKLYNCQNDNEDLCYGDVWNGITKPELYEKWTHNGEPMEKCKTCPLLPECTAFHLCPTGTKNCKIERFNSFDRKLKASYQALKAKEV